MTKNLIIEYNDIIAFHPGYYVLQQIEALNMSQEQLAIRMDVSAKTVSKLVNGLTPMTVELAKKISAMFGTSITLWMNLQTKFDELSCEIELSKELDREKEVLYEIDYKYFVTHGLLESSRSTIEKIKNLRALLNVADLNILRNPDLLAIYKTSSAKINHKNIIPSNTWLQIVMNKANELETGNYDEKKIKNYLNEIRAMTVKPPDEFYPRLLEVFNDSGIRFIIMPHLKNSGINGVTKWLNKDSPVIAINDRRYSSDLFWFALFHELKHVMQRKVKKVLITCDKSLELSCEDREYEKEADEFARDFLIDRKEYKKFIKDDITGTSILKFAEKNEIHPGIVVGRLQHDKILNYSQYNNYKTKYKIIFN